MTDQEDRRCFFRGLVSSYGIEIDGELMRMNKCCPNCHQFVDKKDLIGNKCCYQCIFALLQNKDNKCLICHENKTVVKKKR